MTLMVSGVSKKDNQTIAYVRFEDGASFAEGIIPECKITSSDGFSKEELDQLEEYLRENLATLKRQAAGINPIKAMMKDE